MAFCHVRKRIDLSLFVLVDSAKEGQCEAGKMLCVSVDDTAEEDSSHTSSHTQLSKTLELL